MLEIRNLRKNFESGTEALRGVDLKINKGELLTEENTMCRRSETGISPVHYRDILFKKAKVDIEEEYPLEWNMLE